MSKQEALTDQSPSDPENLEECDSPSPQSPAKLNFQEKTSTATIMKRILLDSIPISLSFLTIMSDKSLILFYLNERTDNSAITAALGAATSFYFLIALSIILSLQQGLMVRVSQAFGARDYRLAGLYFQRGIIINTYCLIPCTIPFFFSKDILVYLGANEEEAILGQDYLYWTLPSMVCIMIFFTLQMTLNACKQFILPAAFLLLMAVMQAVFGFIFIYILDWKLPGAGLTLSISWMISIGLLIFYIKKKDPVPGVFFKFNKESFKGIWELLRFELICGLPSWIAMVSVEVNNLYAVSFGQNQQAAFTVSSTSYKLFLAPAFGLSLSVMSYFGASVGKKSKKLCVKIVKAMIYLLLLMYATELTLSFLIKTPILRSLTPKDVNIEIVVELFNLFMIQFIFDLFNTCLSGICKSIGKEKECSIVSCIASGLVVIPMTFIYADTMNFGINGLVLATASGGGASVFGLIMLLYYVNWDKQLSVVGKLLRRSSSAANLKYDQDKSTSLFDIKPVQDELSD